jgi:hypothetical protein
MIVYSGQQVISELVKAYLTTLRPTPLGAGGQAYFREAWTKYVGPYLAAIPGPVGRWMGNPGRALAQVRLSNAASSHEAWAKRIFADPFMRSIVTLMGANRFFLAGATIAGSLYYYMIPHHATKYVPNRQRYYLGINSAKTFKRLKAKRDEELKDINDIIKLIRPGPDVAAPAGAGAAVRAAAQAARNARIQAYAGFHARRVGISGRLSQILRDREAVTIDPTPAAVIAIPPFRPAPPAPPGAPPPVLPPCPRNPRGPDASAGKPDLEKACCDVEALVIRYRVVCVEIQQLELDVRASAAANGIQINSSAAGFSVVDEVFAQLSL